MGSVMGKPKTGKHNERGAGNGLRYVVSSMQGWPTHMEDAHAVSIKIPNYKSWSYFGVFDGHGGNRIAKFTSFCLLQEIICAKQFRLGNYAHGIRDGFLLTDDSVRYMPVERHGGSTAVCVFVTPSHVYYANCGHSRAVLYCNGTVSYQTRDHLPTLSDERRRICNAGGSVLIKRVNGVLAASRSIGDYAYKRHSMCGGCTQLITAEPEVHRHKRTDADEFLVVASNGIWNVMSSNDVCRYIHARLLVTDDLMAIGNSLLDTCLYKGSCDNMTLIVVALPGAPKVFEQAVKIDKQLNNRLGQLVKEELALGGIQHYDQLLKRLHARDDIRNCGLPPGGGLYAKYHVISDAYKECRPYRAAEVLECEADPPILGNLHNLNSI